MEQRKNEVLPGMLNLLVLKALSMPGPLRLEQIGWISSKWGVPENNRRARYYSITRGGKKRLAAEEENWRRASEIMIRFLEP